MIWTILCGCGLFTLIFYLCENIAMLRKYNSNVEMLDRTCGSYNNDVEMLYKCRRKKSRTHKRHKSSNRVFVSKYIKPHLQQYGSSFEKYFLDNYKKIIRYECEIFVKKAIKTGKIANKYEITRNFYNHCKDNMNSIIMKTYNTYNI